MSSAFAIAILIGMLFAVTVAATFLWSLICPRSFNREIKPLGRYQAQKTEATPSKIEPFLLTQKSAAEVNAALPQGVDLIMQETDPIVMSLDEVDNVVNLDSYRLLSTPSRLTAQRIVLSPPE